MRFLGITLLTSQKWMIEVEKTKTVKWTSGYVYKVVDALKMKYRPTDMLSKLEEDTFVTAI